MQSKRLYQCRHCTTYLYSHRGKASHQYVIISDGVANQKTETEAAENIKNTEHSQTNSALDIAMPDLKQDLDNFDAKETNKELILLVGDEDDQELKLTEANDCSSISSSVDSKTKDSTISSLISPSEVLCNGLESQMNGDEEETNDSVSLNSPEAMEENSLQSPDKAENNIIGSGVVLGNNTQQQVASDKPENMEQDGDCKSETSPGRFLALSETAMA